MVDSSQTDLVVHSTCYFSTSFSFISKGHTSNGWTGEGKNDSKDADVLSCLKVDVDTVSLRGRKVIL